MGIFQITASSGSSSSSSSSHSASLSFTVFRFESCHDCLLLFSIGDGRTSRVLELVRDSERGEDEYRCGLEGDCDRGERVGADKVVLLSEGVEGDEKPRLICLPGAESC